MNLTASRLRPDLLAQKLQLTAYPTLYILDAKGNVLRKMVGFRTAEQLLAEVKMLE